MNKATIIQAKWIELGFEPLSTDDNGWTDYDSLPDNFDIDGLDSKRYKEADVDFETLLVRPKSLEGIEDNNGWVKFTGIQELPAGNFYAYIKGLSNFNIGRMVAGAMSGMSPLFEDSTGTRFRIDTITDWKPMEKVKPKMFD